MYKEKCNNQRNNLEVHSSEESLLTDGWFLHRLNDGEKMVIVLPPVTVIGRQNCGSSLVSPQHVSISILNNEQLYVRDLETRYGTFVNDQRISSSGTIMKEWDILCLGCKRPRNGTEFGFVVRLKDSTVLTPTPNECVDSLVNSTDPCENVASGSTEIKQEPDEKLLMHPVVSLERLPLIEHLAKLYKIISFDLNDKTDSPSAEDSDVDTSQITDYNCSEATTVSLNQRKSSTESAQSSDMSAGTIPARRANNTAAKVENNFVHEKLTKKSGRKKVSQKKVETCLSNETNNSSNGIKSLQKNEQEILNENNAVAPSKSAIISDESSRNSLKHKSSLEVLSYNTDSDSEHGEKDSDYECKVSNATLYDDESSSRAETLHIENRKTPRVRKMQSNNFIATSSSEANESSDDSGKKNLRRSRRTTLGTSNDSDKKFRRISSRTKLGKRNAYYIDNSWGPSKRQPNRKKNQTLHQRN